MNEDSCDVRDGMKDITGAEAVEVYVSDDDKTLWVNTEKGCVLRICRIKELIMPITTGEEEKQEPENLVKEVSEGPPATSQGQETIPVLVVVFERPCWSNSLPRPSRLSKVEGEELGRVAINITKEEVNSLFAMARNLDEARRRK